MTQLGAVIALVWQLIGLYLLWGAGHYVWFAFGIFLPVIPWVYSAVIVLQRYGVIRAYPVAPHKR